MIWLFSGVDPLMDFKRRELSKCLIALGALERSFTTVYPHVPVVRGGRREHLSTFRAGLKDFSRGQVGALACNRREKKKLEVGIAADIKV